MSCFLDGDTAHHFLSFFNEVGGDFHYGFAGGVGLGRNRTRATGNISGTSDSGVMRNAQPVAPVRG